MLASSFSVLLLLCSLLAAVLLSDGFDIASTKNSLHVRIPRTYALMMQKRVNSSVVMSFPPPPLLKRASLPTMLAGGIFLFATSVPSTQRSFANELLKLSEEALRTDPTIAMELGMGIEAGGVYASSYEPYSSENTTFQGKNADRMLLQFQINGGNAWAQGMAYGIRESGEKGRVRLLQLDVANMDAVLNDQSFQVPLVLEYEDQQCCK